MIADQNLVVEKALIEALPYVLDVSPEAKQILIRAFRSENDELISLASKVFGPHLDLSYEFKDLWNADKPLRLWREYELNAHYSFSVTHLTGVGKIKPWKDPAWQLIPRTLQRDLLLRSGTIEAIDILKKEFGNGENFWVHAEIVDPSSLHELLAEPNPLFKKYAAASLITGKDPTYIEDVRSRVEAALKRGEKREFLEIDGQSGYFALPYLETSTLKQILKTDLGQAPSEDLQYFASVRRELYSRGESYSSDQLIPENFIREKNYAILPRLLKKLVSTKSGDMRTLSHSLALNPDFLSSLPDQVAHESYLILKPSVPANFGWNHDTDNTESLLRVVGMIARGKDANELWEKWQRHPDPFMEYAVYIPVLWGFNKRSAELRKILGAPTAFDDLEEFYLPFKKPECRAPSNAIYQFPVALPVFPESIWQADLVLAKSILENFDQVQSDQFAVEFLKARGIEVLPKNPSQSVPHLLDKRYVVRQVLWNWIKDKLPYALNISWIFNYRGVKETVKPNQNISSAEFTLPEPTLSKSDENWIQKQISAAKENYLKRQIEQFYNAPEMVVVPGLGPAPTKIYAEQPDGFFLIDSYSVALMPEIERLTQSADPDLQYAGLWALWNFNRDQKILKIWMRDATSTATTTTDNQLKARALFVLQQIRYKPAAMLFPALLKDPDRRLRQVALFGIQAFKLAENLPEAKSLIHDPDLAVSETAIATLGSFPSATNRELLLSYLKGSERNSFVAMKALIHFKEKADIDAIAALLRKDNLEFSHRNALYAIAKEITHHGDDFVHYSPKDDMRTTRGEIDGWLDWWAQARELPVEERIKAALRRSADKLKEPDAESWWNFHSTDDLWTVLQRSMNSEKTISILLEAYPRQTKHLLFSEFLEKSRSPSYDSVPVSHEILVRISGEDFGNPYIAQCEAKDQIISDWIGWAKENGIIQ